MIGQKQRTKPVNRQKTSDQKPGAKEPAAMKSYRALVGGFVGKQAPVCDRCLERPHIAGVGETPFAVWDSRRWSALLHDLFRGANKKLRHAKMEFMGQSFNLLVERVRQLDFGAFHTDTLAHYDHCGQAQQQT
jgi:hypothetical protein